MMQMKEFAKRRQQLMQRIPTDSVVILPAAPMSYRNNDYAFLYRQQSDFYYLSGFSEPESILVLAPKRKQGEFILFNRPHDAVEEQWNGPRAGQKGACKLFGANQSFAISEFATQLPRLLAGRKHIYYVPGLDPEIDTIVLKHLPKSFVLMDFSDTLHEMRVIKSAAEIALMRKAAEISAKAHIRAMQTCRPGMNEYQLEAELNYECQRHGARSQAYTPIVGSGANACILHYVANNQVIKKGDLVLIDAAGEYENYAADITRTFPASGRFSAEQAMIYNLVLKAQLAGIQAIKPGASFDNIQKIILKILTQGLIEIGLLKGKLQNLLEQKAYLPFYMHKSSHWLGLDVHDAGRYQIEGKPRRLQAGMVLTVEPGIYISATIPGVPKRFHNMGVRIEDDILVTAKGYDVLSKAVPKTIKDIETLMAAPR